MLIIVHLLLAIHIAQWLVTGTTMTPLEPSESMEFAKRSIVNAGLIFFALTILSTLVLGRWFCGWACHLVALQDLCRWLLGKVKLKPKPVRLGVLGLVPLLAFVYMFIAPAVYRLLHDMPMGNVEVHLTTETFWATFPSWIPAILTFLFCGFVIIYLLGAKGFCTYGCPYGAIYGIVDQLAVGSIRVTDACEGCGHCTAVCSSNVRVHQEVRDYGMVVDPGCMKCLDCVSVCPNDALYFGVGVPSMLVRRRAGGTGNAARLAALARALPSWLLIAVFLFAGYSLLMWYDGDLDWRVVSILTAGSLVVAALFKGRSERIGEYTLGEQAVLCVAFVLAMLAFRGLYGMIPLLFALGLAAILSYLTLKALRLIYKRDLGLHGWSLKRAGRLRPAGVVLALVMAGVAVFGVHSGLVQYHGRAGLLAYRQVARAAGGEGVESSLVDRALRHVGRASRLALIANPYDEATIARLHLLKGDLDDYETHMRIAVDRLPEDAALPLELGDFYGSRGRPDDAAAMYRISIDRAPGQVEALVHLGRTLAGRGAFDEAGRAFDQALEADPDRSGIWFNYGVLESVRGRFDDAIARFERAVELDPGFVEARENLAGAYCQVGRLRDGIAQFGEALALRPDAGTHELVARAHFALGELAEGRTHLENALALAPDREQTRELLREIDALLGTDLRDPPDPAGDEVSIEQEVADNILGQVVGSSTLRSFDLPEPFVRRLADRIIRSSYRQRYRRVLPGEGDRGATPPPGVGASDIAVEVRTLELAESVRLYWQSLAEQRPPLRGYRAPILDDAMTPWPVQVPDETALVELREAESIVAEGLARDGLLVTTARVVELLGPPVVADDSMQLLRSVGLPFDLLEHFELPGVSPGARGVVWFVAQRLAEGGTAAELEPELRRVGFRFTPTRPGFKLATEDGRHQIDALRLQLTRGTYWRGPGAGGCLDVARQLVSALPEADLVAGIEQKHVETLVTLTSHWPLRRDGRLTLLAQPLAVAQWAQDNAKSGFVREAGVTRTATIVPRYASRHEDGSVFVPGESLVMNGVASTGRMVFQSPLLFQGGNLLAVRDPATGQRVLLLGEAEVYRNTALGLTAEQVLDAFRIELGVDRCVVVPSVSFHIDYDVSLRVHDGRIVAFVNDTDAALRLIAGLGVDALAAHGVLDSVAAETARGHLEARRDGELVQLVYQRVFAQANPDGSFPLSMAEAFAVDEIDSPIGNFQRFLAAMDALAAAAIAPDQLPPDRHTRSYFRSLTRRRADRRSLHGMLEEQGWKVVGVPSLADAELSLNAVNGIHDPARYLMPAYGGFYAPLDRAAAATFEAELGPVVRVIPVLCGESQRRVGAVHCSVSVLPRPGSAK